MFFYMDARRDLRKLPINRIYEAHVSKTAITVFLSLLQKRRNFRGLKNRTNLSARYVQVYAYSTLYQDQATC